MLDLVKLGEEAFVLTAIVTGIGWVTKKALGETFTADPSSSAVHFIKMTVAVAGAVTLKNYLEKEKYIPQV